jgi:GT2 family glycosyltransferase/tetratricopeptide (TPR) repeat protein
MMPSAGSPLTSLIVVTCNALAFTRLCLESIARCTPEPHEIIVIDNGSSDGTCAYLEARGGVRLIRNDSNRGFPAAVNQGIAAANGEFVLLLNNDVIVTDGWLNGLRRALTSAPGIALAGPRSNAVSGPQCLEPGELAGRSIDEIAAHLAAAEAGRVEDLPRLVGFCLLMRRRLIVDEIGGLDERFGIGNFEDDDLCRRVHAAGYRSVMARAVFVHHFGHASFDANRIDLPALLADNRQLFAEKWTPARSRPLRLSLCMIVRDNERTLAAALASARPWVDELIVVDTGSMDATPDIAREHGATVTTFAWCDDFAAARNASLRHATGDWIFWMDSDDTLPEASGRALRAALAVERPPHVLGLVMQVHCPGTTHDDVTVVDHVKVFRNRADVRFEGRIHEQVLPSIRRAGGDVDWIDAHVVHSGADRSKEGRTAKLARDLRLLELEAADRPGHPFVSFNRGMTWIHAGDYAKAVDALCECVRVSSHSESHLRKAYALLVDALEGLHNDEEAQRRCWEGLGRYPGDAELLFKAGAMAMRCQHWGEAATAFEAILSLPPTRYFSSVDAGILGPKARVNLATSYEALGRPADAERMWREALALDPRYRRAFEGLARLLFQQDRLADAEPVLRALLDLDPQDAAAHHNLGQSLLRQERSEEATRCFELSLALRPEYTPTLRLLEHAQRAAARRMESSWPR